MQSRIVFNLVNQSSIFSDWQENIDCIEYEKNINTILTDSTITQCIKIPKEGKTRFVFLHAITDFFIEERETPESNNLPF